MRRSSADEHRQGMHWMVGGFVFLVLMFGMWWLVASTNREGTHDAQLLPFFALIPLAIGVFHLVRAGTGHRGR